jgi:hypothetical protein
MGTPPYPDKLNDGGKRRSGCEHGSTVASTMTATATAVADASSEGLLSNYFCSTLFAPETGRTKR